MEAKEYQELVKSKAPPSCLWRDCLRAFWVGGLICTVGEGIRSALLTVTDQTSAGTWTSILLVFLGALLTSLGVYDRIGRYAGAGSIVPITGFANGIAASAIEYKPEGFVLGVGAKLFAIAGPVILYGTAAGMLYGVILFLLSLF